ncbi:hypothetical protein [Emticicia sp. W12TSBA100-4]|uniref:hypothetical protein n=1 Tax=Emticicia sp. W12TSBA100-4 TaxID=3160965 RepID=UPI0033059A5D
MAKRNKSIKDKIEVVTQKTPEKIMLDLILSDEKQYLFTDSAEQQLVEMHMVRELFLQHGSRTEVVNILHNEHGYSFSSAWKAVTVTPQIFATIPQELSRAFWVDIHLQKIETTWKTAKELGDAKSMALADKNRDAAIEKYLGTNQMIDQKKLHLPDVEIGFHPELFKDVHDLGQEGLTKLKEAFSRRKKIQREREIIDVDYVPAH